MIQAIQTVYRGYHFRSRLEARWAVFFDALGLIWEYEPEGFVLPGGTSYLPDFRLRNMPIVGDTFVEVKPGPGSTEDDWSKAKLLARSSVHSVLLLAGVPRPSGNTLCLGAVPRLIDQCSLVIGGNETFAYFTKHGFVLDPGGDAPVNPDADFRTACIAARSARFEFGESGATL